MQNINGYARGERERQSENEREITRPRDRQTDRQSDKVREITCRRPLRGAS